MVPPVAFKGLVHWADLRLNPQPDWAPSWSTRRVPPGVESCRPGQEECHHVLYSACLAEEPLSQDSEGPRKRRSRRDGLPVAILTPVTADSLEVVLRANRQARGAVAMVNLQMSAAQSRLDRLTDEDLAAEIASVRRQRKGSE